MKKVFLTLLLAVFTICFTHSNAIAQKSKSHKPKTVKVKSYTTKKGKTVRSHYRSKPSRRKTSGVFIHKIPLFVNSNLRKTNREPFVYS